MSLSFTTIPYFLYAISFVLVISACAESAVQNVQEEFYMQNPQPLEEREVEILPLGSTAPDFNLPGVDGQYYTLDDFKNASILVVVFTCNHCPTAQAYEDRIIRIVADYKDNNVALVAISPNSPLGLLYEELGYSDLNDDYADMIIRTKDKKFNFPYLYDGDTETASLQYGPAATPHAFVFDKERMLRYKGRLDKIEKPGAANAEDLRNAIDAILEGKLPDIQETKTFGCSTKWAWKTKMKKKVDKEWASKDVLLNEIDIEKIKELVSINNSEKLRLINVWATWCGPCVLEYHDFVKTQRMFGARDFEFISLSMDKLEKKQKALEFLKSKQSALLNYISAEEDKYALIEAVDEEWNGALPYTLLIEPGGKIAWRHQGSVDFYELRKVIVEHPLIGRYY